MVSGPVTVSDEQGFQAASQDARKSVPEVRP